MDLFEYQARDLFEAHGVPVLRGIVARTPDEATVARAAGVGDVVERDSREGYRLTLRAGLAAVS